MGWISENWRYSGLPRVKLAIVPLNRDGNLCLYAPVRCVSRRVNQTQRRKRARVGASVPSVEPLICAHTIFGS